MDNNPLIIGIDLGNTNTCVAFRYAGDSRPQFVFTPDGDNAAGTQRHLLRTAVWYADSSPTAIIGRKALDCPDSDGRLITNFKQALIEADEVEAMRGGKAWNAYVALAQILDALHSFSLRSFALREDLRNALDSDAHQLGGQGFHLCIGVPTEIADLYKNRILKVLSKCQWYRNERVVEAALASGHLQIIPEPIAALMNQHSLTATERKNWIVVDYGGLTLDLALAEYDPGCQSPFTILNKSRVELERERKFYNIGGSFLDRLLLEVLFDRLGGVSSHSQDIVAWYQIFPGNLRQLAQLVSLAVSFDELPPDDSIKKIYTRLILDVERMRIALSEQESVPISFGGHVIPNASISRRELEASVLRPVIQRITQEINLLDAQSSTPGETRILLTGGVSQTPLLLETFRKEYGRHRVCIPTDPPPLLDVAAGLTRVVEPVANTPSMLPGVQQAIAPIYRASNEMSLESVNLNVTGGITLVQDQSDTDYAILGTMKNSTGKIWFTVVKRGTQVSVSRDQASSRRFAVKGRRDIILPIGQRIKNRWREIGRREFEIPEGIDIVRILFFLNPATQSLTIELQDEYDRRIYKSDVKYSVNSKTI